MSSPPESERRLRRFRRQAKRDRARYWVFRAFKALRERRSLECGWRQFDLTADLMEDGGEIGPELGVFALKGLQERRERFDLLPERGQLVFVRHAPLLDFPLIVFPNPSFVLRTRANFGSLPVAPIARRMV